MQQAMVSPPNKTLWTRRKFLTASALSAAGFLTGCAVNPVTGKRQLMLVSEAQELAIDQQNAPYQFSSDLGVTQETPLNQYITSVGRQIAQNTHRKQMPYSFQVVNATYINAYAFPGGTIAATRGIMLSLENEAELAALLGHELGHVNARHTARQMSKNMIAQMVATGVAAYASTYGDMYGELAAQLGMLSSEALLAHYSRDNEREADALGLGYMVRSGYGTNGMLGLMGMLRDMSHHKPNAIELMFSTHPMSEERYQNAVRAIQKTYPYAQNAPLHKERYMDHTAPLRAIKASITAMQKGQEKMAKQQYGEAESYFKTALNKAPNDYAAHILMSKCQIAQEKYPAAQQYAEKAARIYPNEAQAVYLGGYTKIKTQHFESAYADFNAYDRLLPGNPSTLFFKGLALEGMQKIGDAANYYKQFLKVVPQGEQAEYSYQRLVAWGYVK